MKNRRRRWLAQLRNKALGWIDCPICDDGFNPRKICGTIFSIEWQWPICRLCACERQEILERYNPIHVGTVSARGVQHNIAPAI